VTLHGLGELIVSCSGREPDFRVQRKEPDVVAMPSRRRTRPHIANFTTVISALDTRSGDMLLLGNVRINVALLCRNVIENPVCETAGLGRIRIVKNQNKGLGLGRGLFPGKFRRDVVTLASEATRDGCSSGEIRPRQLHGTPLPDPRS